MKGFSKVLFVVALAILVGLFAVPNAFAQKKGDYVEGTIEPDADTAVVIFGNVFGGATIWDGDTPVAKVDGNKMVFVAYRAQPGTHYFMTKRFNWAKIKMDLEANETYYVYLISIPNPVPFAPPMVALQPWTEEEASHRAYRNVKTWVFTDSWSTKFKADLKERDLEEMNENLADAKANH